MVHKQNASHLIVPPTGAYAGGTWPENANLQHGLHGSISMANWTHENEGYAQQTFLGASIRSFSMKGGFGDSSSDLTLSLVVDEYNVSDTTSYGLGDDVYHNGKHDKFMPPPVGSPVFFKFGKNHATVEQAWIRTLDTVYYGAPSSCKQIPSFTTPQVGPIASRPQPVGGEAFFSGVPIGDRANLGGISGQWFNYPDTTGVAGLNNKCRGFNHLVFGGILQSYTQNRGPSANPEYSVTVKDPREILSNAVLILNNYAGTTYNNKNLFNLYGFLQHDCSDELNSILEINYSGKDILRKVVDTNTAEVTYEGKDVWVSGQKDATKWNLPDTWPVTGEGFSRRSDAGIPFYRVQQALDTILMIEASERLKKISVPINAGPVFPEEFINAGFGGFVDFRGFNYVVDLGGIPLDKIPDTYFLEFDQIDILSLCQEICDVISHDFFVQLLPIVDHPSTELWYKYNNHIIQSGSGYDRIIAGVIRVDAIDRSKQPVYGSIKRYIDNLPQEMNVTNEDIGFELSNVVTDRFVVGAQKTDMHFFHTNNDRDFLEVRKKEAGLPNKVKFLEEFQWYHDCSLRQQVLPFYGFLGDAVSIPRGWGSYQQIQIDTTALNAHGVGNYYIATELELRAAAISYEKWKEFLVQYNDVYMESMEEDDAAQIGLLAKPNLPAGSKRTIMNLSEEYGVSVPRCVFESDIQECDEFGLPKSPCSPPYGYPLYYKRAERIGIPEAGVVRIQAALTRMITSYAEAKTPGAAEEYSKKASEDIKAQMQAELNRIQSVSNGLSEEELEKIKTKYRELEKRMEEINSEFKGKVDQIKEFVSNNQDLLKSIHRLGKETIENSYRVYNFLKSVADENLGKKFLVKLPQYANWGYNDQVVLKNCGTQAQTDAVMDFEKGPWGFDYLPISSGEDYRSSSGVLARMQSGLLMTEDYPVGANGNTVNLGPIFFRNNPHYLRDPRTYFDHAGGVQQAQSLTSITHKEMSKDGALKCNWNTMSEKWEHNYIPEPKGGYFDNRLYWNSTPASFIKDEANFGNLSPGDLAAINVSLGIKPPLVQQKLFPTDLTNFVQDGRMKAYVRFDNSQFLTFDGVDSKSFTQEQNDGNGFIPDVALQLDNTKSDEFTAFQTSDGGDPNEETESKAIAFMTCTLDPQLYMPPMSVLKDVKVFGREVVDSGTITPPKVYWDKESCEWRESVGYYISNFLPDSSGGWDGTTVKMFDYERSNRHVFAPKLAVPEAQLEERMTGLINTDSMTLDSGNVYALITLPTKVKPTIDSRFQDGPYQVFQAPLIKHYLTMDTVSYRVDGFEKPDIRGTPMRGIQLEPELTPASGLQNLCDQASFTQVFNAFAPYKAALSKMSLATAAGRLHVSAPSPVYPNLVVLPLTSTEKCYGPWLSSQIANTAAAALNDIGGRIEFVKEESLAPWNYGGYSLLEEAGKFQAQFSNSLMLFSERGGFTIPDVPSGVSLCEALIDGGPLVTDISVSITENSITSTYKMDLYTTGFGKLDKQKEIALSKVIRERQKQRDINNMLIRNGLGKTQTSRDFSREFAAFGGLMDMSNVMNTQKPAVTNNITISTTTKRSQNTDLDGNSSTTEEFTQEGSMQSEESIKQAMQLAPDGKSARTLYNNTASADTTDMYGAYSNDEYHATMPTTPNMLQKRTANLNEYYNKKNIG